MLRIITNSKEAAFTTTTIPDHLQHGYNWAGYLKCMWCYVLVAPLVIQKLQKALNEVYPNRMLNRCPNCGSLWHK